jgi:hypothetical protein
MSDALAEAHGRRLGQHLADGGFARLGDNEDLAQAVVEIFVPAPPDKPRDRHQPRPDDARRWPRGGAGAWRIEAIERERPATAALANAQARDRALARFPMRGIDQVEVVAVWQAPADNLTCTCRLAAIGPAPPRSPRGRRSSQPAAPAAAVGIAAADHSRNPTPPAAVPANNLRRAPAAPTPTLAFRTTHPPQCPTIGSLSALGFVQRATVHHRQASAQAPSPIG